MHDYAARIEIMASTNDELIVKKLNPLPPHRFEDVSRNLRHGLLWSWGVRGQPAVIGTFEVYGGNTSFELVSLALDGAQAVTPDGWKWRTDESAASFRQLDDVPIREDDTERRESQMVEMLNRFSTKELNARRQTTILDFIDKPTYRYSDPDVGIIDCAMFLVTHESNPEVVLFLESRLTASHDQQWQFAFARVRAASVSV